MNKLVLIVLAIGAIGLDGCKQINATKENSIELIDERGLKLGKVVVRLPLEFDTTYRWLSTSDCMCCESVLYRSNSKNYDIIKESGFFHGEELDSGFYFTIGHYPVIQCDTQGPPSWDLNPMSSAKILEQNIGYFIKDLSKRTEGEAPEVLVDTGRIINDHEYNILYFNELLGHNPFNKLTASTEHNNRSISFTIQSNVHSKDSFYLIAMNILKSVKIK